MVGLSVVSSVHQKKSLGEFHLWEIPSKAALQWTQTLSEALQEPLLRHSSALELLSPQQKCKPQSRAATSQRTCKSKISPCIFCTRVCSPPAHSQSREQWGGLEAQPVLTSPPYVQAQSSSSCVRCLHWFLPTFSYEYTWEETVIFSPPESGSAVCASRGCERSWDDSIAHSRISVSKGRLIQAVLQRCSPCTPPSLRGNLS